MAIAVMSAILEPHVDLGRNASLLFSVFEIVPGDLISDTGLEEREEERESDGRGGRVPSRHELHQPELVGDPEPKAVLEGGRLHQIREVETEAEPPPFQRRLDSDSRYE